jgi:hypothetical protein
MPTNTPSLEQILGAIDEVYGTGAWSATCSRQKFCEWIEANPAIVSVEIEELKTRHPIGTPAEDLVELLWCRSTNVVYNAK